MDSKYLNTTTNHCADLREFLNLTCKLGNYYNVAQVVAFLSSYVTMIPHSKVLEQIY